MSNTIGIQQTASGKEIKAIAKERATYHTSQSKSLSDVFKSLVEVQATLNKSFASDAPNRTPSTNNSAISSMIGLAIAQTENQISYHNSRAQASKFTLEHVTDEVKYDLSSFDLVNLGIIDAPNPRQGAFSASQWAGMQQIVGAAVSQQG